MELYGTLRGKNTLRYFLRRNIIWGSGDPKSTPDTEIKKNISFRLSFYFIKRL